MNSESSSSQIPLRHPWRATIALLAAGWLVILLATLLLELLLPRALGQQLAAALLALTWTGGVLAGRLAD